jgi:hypothetical protein
MNFSSKKWRSKVSMFLLANPHGDGMTEGRIEVAPNNTGGSMARPVRVYVSCVLDDLADERLALKQAVQDLPLTVQWEFDFTSVSSGSLSNEYLDRVWDCDLYVLLVGESISETVKREYDVAADADKPMVMLIEDVPHDDEAKMFIRDLKKKPRPRDFRTIDDLIYQVDAGVSDELIKCYKRLRLDGNEMRELAKRRVENIAEERRRSRDWKGSALMMGVLLIMVVIAILVGRGNNAPPFIERMAADPAQVTVGETTNLRVWAKDEGAGVLSYQWAASAGEIEQGESYDNPFAVFHAPDTPGVVTVRVNVADALGLEVDETMDITVVDR